jgi:hypothetical protein
MLLHVILGYLIGSHVILSQLQLIQHFSLDYSDKVFVRRVRVRGK